MAPDNSNLIRLPASPSRQDCIDAFWKWIRLLASDDYERATLALFQRESESLDALQLKEQITSFFGGDKPWCVVVPNQRLIDKLNDAFEFENVPDQKVRSGILPWKKRVVEGGPWFRGLIPLTNEPANPLDDEIPLMGLGVSFFGPRLGDCRVLEFEIFYA